jgi:uncharacterized protein YndB with AHSA1/START domain
MNTNQITVETTVNAPAEKVWNYLSDPAHIVKWNNASPDWHTPKAENDMRTGGGFNYRMEAKDGSAGFDFKGAYDEVVPGERYTYTMEDGRKAVNVLSPEGDKTKVTVTFDPENENPIEMQRGGWQAILDNLKAYAESQ